MALVHRVGWEPQFIARSPWFWPLGQAATRFEAHTDWPTVADFDRLYAELSAGKDVRALRFGDNVRKQDKRIGGRVNLDALYDARIAKHGEVPSRTRDWHDFFNALCFATFPRAKFALHARQHAILEQRVGSEATQLPGARTREQDALTLFDEGGVVVAADAHVHAQLHGLDDAERQHHVQQWVAHAVQARHCTVEVLGGRAAIVPFGHALFEHLIEGLRCPGGCTQWIALSEVAAQRDRLLDAVDVALAAALCDPQRFVSPKQCGGMPLSLR